MSSTNQSVNLILKNGTMKSSLKNHTIFTRDNLEVMRGMADECIDLIYLDPPFNSNHNYAAPIGSEAAGAEFKDTWTLSDIDLAWYGEIENQYSGLYMLLSATRQVHGKSRMAYLIYMAIRVMEMKRILKPTGSIFLHCDPTASHYLKLMMDEIFGNKNSRNEIAWCYIDPAGRRNSNYYKKTHDIIFWYAKNKNKYKTNVIAKSGLAESTLKRYGKYFDGNGQITYRRLKETNPGTFKSLKSIPEDLDEVWLDKEKGTNMSDWWNDIVPIKRKGGNQNPKEKFLYPTQKPIALLERILETASSEKDIVLDPFCGCATACVAAEKLWQTVVRYRHIPKGCRIDTNSSKERTWDFALPSN